MHNEKSREILQVVWKIIVISSLEAGQGVHFFRTNVESLNEKTIWKDYNLIREIECTNKQLKNDLNLYPIYHQTDARCDAHLFFGLALMLGEKEGNKGRYKIKIDCLPTTNLLLTLNLIP